MAPQETRSAFHGEGEREPLGNARLDGCMGRLQVEVLLNYPLLSAGTAAPTSMSFRRRDVLARVAKVAVWKGPRLRQGSVPGECWYAWHGVRERRIQAPFLSREGHQLLSVLERPLRPCQRSGFGRFPMRCPAISNDEIPLEAVCAIWLCYEGGEACIEVIVARFVCFWRREVQRISRCLIHPRRLRSVQARMWSRILHNLLLLPRTARLVQGVGPRH